MGLSLVSLTLALAAMAQPTRVPREIPTEQRGIPAPPKDGGSWGSEISSPKEQRQVLSALTKLRSGGRPTASLHLPLVLGPGLWDVLTRQMGMPPVGVRTQLVVPGKSGADEMAILNREEHLQALSRSMPFRALVEGFSQGLVGPATIDQRRYLQVQVAFPLRGQAVTAVRKARFTLLALVTDGTISWLELVVTR